jgi:hypothetical protein
MPLKIHSKNRGPEGSKTVKNIVNQGGQRRYFSRKNESECRHYPPRQVPPTSTSEPSTTLPTLRRKLLLRHANCSPTSNQDLLLSSACTPPMTYSAPRPMTYSAPRPMTYSAPLPPPSILRTCGPKIPLKQRAKRVPTPNRPPAHTGRLHSQLKGPLRNRRRLQCITKRIGGEINGEIHGENDSETRKSQ